MTPSASDAESGLCNKQRRPKTYRKLAICSIICGLSCIGIVSLINSVKAEESKSVQKSKIHSKKALKYGIIAIVAWVLLLISIPLVLGLLSYLLTFIN
ncbi:transmembrane protein 265-like [Trichomycterus rosablanca]|uniref:transmembrane protein 265-like n=1 Tax=Trichomycterus rosablanca TaxID=2290929 RepID=UPI002F35A49A